MKVIYISGKITGIEKEAVVLFQKAKKYLEGEGFKVVNPMELPDDHDKSWNSYMKVCLKALNGCDGIYMLNNYKDSKGALLELELAERLRLTVDYENCKDLLTHGRLADMS